MNKLLIDNNIALFTITVIRKSLEDEFMEVTKGSKDQIR